MKVNDPKKLDPRVYHPERKCPPQKLKYFKPQRIIPIDKLDPDFCNWFAGFSDGESSFTLRMPYSKNSKGFDFDCEFSIGLRKDDEKILEQIIKKLSLTARISYLPALTSKQGIFSNPRAQLSVRRTKNCLRIIEIFDKYPLRAKKLKNYKLWKKTILTNMKIPKGTRHTGAADRSEVVKLIKQLRELRKYKE